MVPPPLLLRARPPKPVLRLLRHAWKPPAPYEQRAWTRATLRHLRHSPLLPPDGWLPLAHFARPEHAATALAWIDNDRQGRIEVERRPDPPGTHIRARAGHSVPDVRLSTVRVRHPSAIPSLIYATDPANWPDIERDGIRPHLPPLLVPNPSNRNFIYFSHYIASLAPPVHPPSALQLHISIDVSAAMKAGIKFYATNTNQIISTGLPDSTIPHRFFNGVWAVSLKSQQLDDFAQSA